MKQKSVSIIGFIILIAISMFVILRSNRPQVLGDPITVTALLPLTGGTADFYGEYTKRGITLAVNDINRAGGIIGRKLIVDYQDSQGIPKTGLQAIQAIAAKGQHVVIGDVISGVTLAVAPVVGQNHILYITPGSASPAVTNSGDYVFRTRVSATIEANADADFLAKTMKAHSVALLYQNSDFGIGTMSAMKADILSKGLTVVNDEKYDLGAADVRTQLTKIKQDNPDVVVMAGYSKEVGLILKQAQELGLHTKFFAHSSSFGPDTIQVGGSAANALIVLSESYLDSSNSQATHFLSEYRATYHQEPEVLGPLAYDTIKLISKSLAICGTNPDCIKQNLYTTHYNGVTGPIAFDKNGDIIRNHFTALIIEDGKFVPYKP